MWVSSLWCGAFILRVLFKFCYVWILFLNAGLHFQKYRNSYFYSYNFYIILGIDELNSQLLGNSNHCHLRYVVKELLLKPNHPSRPRRHFPLGTWGFLVIQICILALVFYLGRGIQIWRRILGSGKKFGVSLKEFLCILVF